MAQTARTPTIPLARSGPITDLILDQVISAGMALQQDRQPSEAELTLILMTVPQLARELLQRRRAMGVISDMIDIENVTFLPGA